MIWKQGDKARCVLRFPWRGLSGSPEVGSNYLVERTHVDYYGTIGLFLAGLPTGDGTAWREDGFERVVTRSDFEKQAKKR